jgi:predicted Zn-dependent peptidase
MIREIMKKMACGAFVAALLIVQALTATPAARAAGTETSPARAIDKLEYPKLHPIKQPTVVRETLPNGMKLILIEDRDLPKIELRAVVRGGRLAEPKGKPGLCELFGEVFRTGGTQTMSGDQVDEFLEKMGAAIESGVEDDSSSIYARSLTENLDAVLPLFAEFLQRPAFAQEKIDLAKTHLKSGIARRNDEVMGIAQREFMKLIYGASSPYARQYEYDDVDALTREDLVAFHARGFRPDRTTLAAWGDFKASEMKEKLAKTLASWKNEGPTPKYDLPPIPSPAYSVNYIEKKDVEQTFMLLGHQGLRYDDPDYPAVRMLSDILGGGFSSRIFMKVRTEKGLAYGAGGMMVPAYDHPGNYYFFTSTKPSTTAEALSTMLDEIKKIREAPVTDAELKKAKEGYLNTYAFDFDSKGKIVNRLMTYDFYGYPEDFNTRLRDAVEKVTKEDILRVAQKHLRPDLLTVLAIGKAAEFDRPLSTFGNVATIDITIPQPKSSEQIPPATPESLARGNDLLKQAARAKGEQALLGLKDLVTEGTATYQTPMGAIEVKFKSSLVLPDRLHAEINTPMGQMTQVFDGQRGWVVMGPNTQDLPASAVEEFRRTMTTDSGCLLLAREALAGKVTAQALGKTTFEGQQAEAVVVRMGESPIRVFLSADGQRVLGTRSQGQTQEGPAEIVEIFGGYSAVSGLQVPMETTQNAGGKPVGATKVTSVKVNSGVDPALFQKPAPAGK